MAAPTNIPKDQVQNLLSDAITVLCKNTLRFHTEMCVEGLLGITLDKKDVILINIKEIMDRTNTGRDMNTTCRECRGLGKIMLHSDVSVAVSESSMGSHGINSQLSTASGYPTPISIYSNPAQTSVRTVVSPPAPPQNQRQIFHSILPSQGDILQRAEPAKIREATIMVPQGQHPTVQHHPSGQHTFQDLQTLQPPPLSQSSSVVTSTPTPSHTESIDMDIGGHCSEDEVAATIIKKPRVYRNPRKAMPQVIPQFSVSQNITNIKGNSSATSMATQMVTARVSSSPQQKHIRVKMEPQKENSNSSLSVTEDQQQIGFASMYNNSDTVELSPMLVTSEGMTIKRTLSHETSQSPKLLQQQNMQDQIAAAQLQHLQIPAPPAVVFNPDDDDNLSDINNPSIPTSEDFYAFFTSKLDVPTSMGGKPIIPIESSTDSAQQEMSNIQNLHEIEPGEIVFPSTQTPVVSKGEDNVGTPYQGSIEISPKSSLGPDVGENSNEVLVTDDQDVSSFLAEEDPVPGGKTSPGPGRLLPEDVVSAQIILLDRQPVFSASGQPLPTAHSTLSEGTSVLVESVKPARKAPGGKFGPKLQPKTVVVHKADLTKSQSKKGHSATAGFSSMESVKVFMCPYCNKVFRHRASLVRHKHVHKGKLCSCFMCGKKFHRRDVLNRHINAMHKRLAGDVVNLTGDLEKELLDVQMGVQHSVQNVQQTVYQNVQDNQDSEHTIHGDSLPVQSEQIVNVEDEQSNDVEIIEPEKEVLQGAQ